MIDEEQREGWIPSSEEERRSVREQLERMLESPLFRNSKRYPILLRHLVEETLAGNEAALKERLLGVSVFHRPTDYDTNQDTVVRLTAGEVRRRIAQYYHQPEHADELKIEVRPGSYIPCFQKPDSKQPEPAPQPEEILVATPVETYATSPEPKIFFGSATADRHKRLFLWAAAMLFFVLLGAGGMVWRWDEQAHTADHQLWAPILQEPGPVLIVLADLSKAVSNAQSQEKHGPFFDLLRMGEIVNYRDSMAETGIVAQLERNRKPYILTLSTQATYPDLQRGASVLVGGLDNLWTLRVTDALRFHFVQIPGSYHFVIQDRQHPEQKSWGEDLSQEPTYTEDYALVARLFDQTTGRPVMLVAGVGANGTTAATRFLLEPAFTAELNQCVPHDWQRLNLEAVVRTQILDNHAGPPHLVACAVW